MKIALLLQDLLPVKINISANKHYATFNNNTPFISVFDTARTHGVEAGALCVVSDCLGVRNQEEEPHMDVLKKAVRDFLGHLEGLTIF